MDINETQFLQYVMYVLSDSRSKRQAESRISGLIQKRLQTTSNLVEYDIEMIKQYEKDLENEKKKGK